MNKIFLRTTAEISLLEGKSGRSMKVVNIQLSHFIMGNDEYLKRCLSEIKNGKQELIKRLEDAKRVIFTEDGLVNWLYKIKEDAQTETDMIFVRYDATVGMEEKKIDFERAGFLAGIYEEADRYLALMAAIEPLDKNKPDYSILDRLEELDNIYIRTDNIPGYYSIQIDSKIIKKKYEIENLSDYWTEYLSIKDGDEIIEGFGDVKYLLSKYHYEFCLELCKIRPREEIKDFLNFHLKKYSGSPIDFLNHIEFRIMPDLYGVASSDYLIYQLLLKDWLKEKRNKLNKASEEYLLDSVISVSAAFIDNITEFRKSEDENKYNIAICLLLNQRFSNRGWSAKDQSMGGSTDSESKAKKAGIAFRDIIVTDDKNNHISAMECFRLKYVPTQIENDSEITLHLKKIFRNEPIGLSPLFILIYCETKSFTKTWEKYLNYISKINFYDYSLLDLQRNVKVNTERASINISKTKHKRDTSEIDVYHIFINMYP